jgi:catechol 2,3-dioxygenase-like lactoylglutathione lyase family enzyme
MIDHTGIGVANVARSAALYDAALGALGLRRVMQLPENDGSGVGIDAAFMLGDADWTVRSGLNLTGLNRGSLGSFRQNT